ncbi:MAG: MaoC family dehydratase [Candidatus Accumulibacter sp.]|jgi:acyl dehydratase|nr:MaoC family dehydratase [Accumulibacter sp.]
MSDFYLKVGDSVTFSKTVSESDIYLFAGITGDLSPNHVNEEFMKRTRYGKRIAHGALLIGYMSNASSKIIEVSENKGDGSETPVSLGYDRIRFLDAVCIGDTITVTYTVREIDVVKRRSVSSIVITNQTGKEVTVATHILKWVAA